MKEQPVELLLRGLFLQLIEEGQGDPNKIQIEMKACCANLLSNFIDSLEPLDGREGNSQDKAQLIIDLTEDIKRVLILEHCNEEVKQ